MGCILCTVFLVFLNVPIPQEPFTLWSQLPYAGMFQYAGIVCLIGAILFLMLETVADVPLNTRNIIVVLAVAMANVVSFAIGAYYTRVPVLYLTGLLGTTVFSAWMTSSMKTKDLVIYVGLTSLVAALDEYAHTSAGTLHYYDNAVPSPLTVFGWSLFIIPILSIAWFVKQRRLFSILDRSILRPIPAITSLFLVAVTAMTQGYSTTFDWKLVLVYILLTTASLYYSLQHAVEWNILILMTSWGFGLIMEFLGQWEGLWIYRFSEPVSLLILFSWPLRIWTVNLLCTFLNVDLSEMPSRLGLPS